jgi:hypothetical protein
MDFTNFTRPLEDDDLELDTRFTYTTWDDPEARLARMAAADPGANAKPEPEVQRKRARKQPRQPRPQKGSPEYQQQLEFAQEGLPPFADTHWMTVQLRDEGQEVRGRTRYSVKVEATSMPVEQCKRSTIRTNRRTRWANLSTVKRFRINIRDNKRLDEKSRTIAADLIAFATQHDDVVSPHGAPPCLIGFFNTRFEGTRTFVGQFAMVCWMPTEDAWLPEVTLTQPDARRVLTLSLPPPINRDGAPRSPTCKFSHITTWYSPELQSRIDEGKRIKAAKKA